MVFSSSKCERVIKEGKWSNLFFLTFFLLWVMAQNGSQQKKKRLFTYWPNICKSFIKQYLALTMLDTWGFLLFVLLHFVFQFMLLYAVQVMLSLLFCHFSLFSFLLKMPILTSYIDVESHSWIMAQSLKYSGLEPRKRRLN